MNRQQLIKDLNQYSTEFEEEEKFIPVFNDLLTNYKNCFSRSLAYGHVTGSGWVINSDYSKSLLVHHKKLNKWLQPGGHADGNEDVRQVAMNEVTEETGLSSFISITESFFDVDIHLIPKHNLIPAHYHFDFRFLFVADEKDNILVSAESNDVKWFKLDEIERMKNANPSLSRMILKTRSKTFSIL